LTGTPRVITSPADQFALSGKSASFALAAEGGSPITYKWQRLPVGATSWVDLADDGTFSGTRSATLVANATSAMNGDQFQCAVTSGGVSTTSSPATLVVTTPLAVATIAGAAGASGITDGTATTARFVNMQGVAVDANGTIYATDTANNTIRKITATGTVSTFAGQAGATGSDDGPVSTARFNAPLGITIDSVGNLYVADSRSHTIRKITAAGVVSTLAGAASINGSADGTGPAASFNTPSALAVDARGNVFVCDTNNHTIRKITPAGVVSTVAGTAGTSGATDGTGANALFSSPSGIAIDSTGNLFVASTGFGTLRKITPAGVVTTLAGKSGNFGANDGVAANARFSAPNGLAIDRSGNIFVADYSNNVVRQVTPTGVTTTPAGLAPNSGTADGIGTAARFKRPFAIAVDGIGTLYVADTSNYTIRKAALSAAPQITTQPQNANVNLGQDATLTAVATGWPVPTYQWQKNGVNIAGATNANLTLAKVQAADSGNYSVVVTNSAGSATSSVATTLVTLGGRLGNLSIRSNAGSGDQMLIVGFVAGGPGTGGNKPMLLRAIGPSLAAFGVAGFLPDPKIALFNAAQQISGNDDWNGDAQVTTVGAQVGAFPLTAAASKDAALFTTQPMGGYTVQVSGADGAAGNVLMEIYDATSGSNIPATTLRFVNISARTQVGVGDDILIAGFSIAGQTSRTVLIRAIGPALVPFGVGGALADPPLRLYAGSNLTAANDNWSSAADASQVASAAGQVGAFALPSGSLDAALLVTLAPGSYTAQVVGAGNTTGVALIEIYEIP